ncbi:MAG: DMT family transporter [Gammaproteobacteria bacterium]|nr:DMT family transporter [Gammaproteobacteria bacterium]MDH4256867.1 DMT family transporter [Gammaproteobacteria bacterium]MDH5310089.1 DMT family transporter [Gammaproteobacteria bacterium]
MPTDDKTTPHQEHVVLGMLAALGAFFVFTVMNVFAKLLSVRHSVIEIAFYRNLIACMPFLFMAFAMGKREMLVIRSQPKAIVFRAVLGAMSLMTTFAAFALMPMAETTVLLFTASLFMPVLGVLILQEHVGPYRWAAIVVGFIGVVIMTGPSGTVNALGLSVALAAALMHATLGIVLRHLGKHESPETIVFYFLVIGVLVTALPMPFVAVWPAPDEAPLLVGVGLCGALAQWLLSTAYRHAPAALVTVFNYTGIVWATLFGVLIWNEWPTSVVLAGGGVVIASNVLIIWRESRLRQVTGAGVRAKL